MLEPLIHGGKSTTVFRSGTPAVGLIVSLAKALRLVTTDLDQKINHVSNLNERVRQFLTKYSNVVINSTEYSLPHVLNFSILGVKPETFVHALEEDEIYISTKSACSAADAMSKPVYALTGNEDLALASLRISLSFLTTDKEIGEFIESFEKNYRKLVRGIR
jgi:cysteine desulfurase